MTFRLTQNDCKILEDIAEHRVLSPAQIALLQQKGRQVIWRRLRTLEGEGLVRMLKRDLGQNRGRPERLLGLTAVGVDILKDKGFVGQDTPYEKVGADEVFCLNHQLLLNWFRIHLNQVERVLPRLHAKFLAYNSPVLPQDQNGYAVITDYAHADDANGQLVRFIPDGVFVTIDSQGITCLFFLEIDCGTETIASPRRSMKDVRQKIINYQSYFRSLKYKKYEQMWNCQLNGFRLLFMTNSHSRLAALCRLVQEMPPTDFIWLTEQGRMFTDGIFAAIWARGGKLDHPSESILGSLSKHVRMNAGSA